MRMSTRYAWFLSLVAAVLLAGSATAATITYKGKERTVEVGPRGGRYVTAGGRKVYLSSLRRQPIATRPAVVRRAFAPSSVRSMSSVGDREAAAKVEVLRALDAAGYGRNWTLTAPLVQYHGDAENPITGLGMVRLFAKRQGAGDGPKELRFTVLVGAGGRSQVLRADKNDALHRVLRFVTDRVPVREIAGDLVKSIGVKRGLAVSGFGGAFAMQMGAGPLGLGAVALVGLKLMHDGIERRRVARSDALLETAGKLQAQVRAGQHVTPSEAYELYRVVLDKLKHGTTPLPMYEFTEKLRAFGL